MDSESLDSCIQSTLAALYPPFEVTGATVLCQVLDVVETSYRGDGLRYLIDFLVPAKHVLQSIQQEACFPYCGFLFRHEGWPLCIHEKIVIQLSSLDRRILQPGDFYLQVAASPKHSPGVSLKCLSASGQHVEELQISQLAHSTLFSMAWLDSINRDRAGDGRPELRSCLLSADNNVFRVPWEDVVHPEFISRPPQESQHVLGDGNVEEGLAGEQPKRRVWMEQQCREDSSGRSSAADDSEGEYVELAELPLAQLSPQNGSLTQSISTDYRNLHPPRTTGPAQGPHNASHSSGINSAPSQSGEDLTEPFQPPSHRQEIHRSQPVSKGTAPSAASPPEHVPDNQCVPEQSACRSKTDFKPDADLNKCASCDSITLARSSQDWSDQIMKASAGVTDDQGGESVDGTGQLVPASVRGRGEAEVPIESENGACGKSSCDAEEGSPGSVGPLGEPVDWTIVRAETQVTAGPGQEGAEQGDQNRSECEVEKEQRETDVSRSETGQEEQGGSSETESGAGTVLHTEPKGADEAGVTRSSLTENELADAEFSDSKIRTEPEIRPVLISDVPNADGSAHTQDAPVESTPVAEGTEMAETEDEPASPANGTQLETHPEPLQQQQQGSIQEEFESRPPAANLQDPVAALDVCVRSKPVLTEARHINPDVLSSGVLCLPGTRDKSGRALVTATTRNSAWLNPDCNSSELLRIMVYFYSILRNEVRALGLTVLVDARKFPPVPALFRTFDVLQEAKPGCIHSVLLLADKDLALRTEKPTYVQVELLTSLKSLQKHVDISQLPTEFDGTFGFSHSSWMSFRMRVEQLMSHCEDAASLLQSTISTLESAGLPPTAEEAQALLCRSKELMKSVLEDSRLVRLQLEGGAALSRLRKEETSVSLTDDYRDAIEGVSGLYNQVDELVHKLVMLSNKCTQELEFVMEFKSLEEGFKEVSQWIAEVGESGLQTLEELEDSLEQLRHKQALFRDFYAAAYDHCKRGEALLQRLERWEDVSSAELQVYEVKVRSFWVQLHDFSQRVEEARVKLDKTVRLHEFYDKAYEWALEGMRRLACVSMEDCSTPDKCQGVMACLESYRSQHVPIPDARFQDMKDLAMELKSDQGLKQWKFAWSKCQETKQMFEKKLEVALRARHYGSGPDVPQERSSSLSFSCRKAFSRDRTRDRLSSVPCSPAGTSLRTPTGSPCHTENRIPSSTPLSSHRLTRSTSSDESPYPSQSTSPLSMEESKRRVLRKTQSFDVSGSEIESRYGTCQRTLSEPARRGNTGVFIKGLEVSSVEVADRPYSPRLAHNWASQDPRRTGSPATEPRAKGSKLRHIVDEMVTTEREYVRSLRYILDHYFPEMERPDLPQDLRGKRSVIFGNLEKLVDFHSQYFLKELESCCNHPLRVSHCFLRHQDQFGLYALYSKNKPKSDALLASHGNSFFKHKQLELEDKMDLASYLLKPMQRMSKYALLLKDLIKEVNEAQEQELAYLRAAAEMVKFQLRHGNDLLAMDAIRDCDVNLKEQGQLVRQDEFTIWYGRKKCQRHVFLFEDLVLFSKPKRIEGGLDVYIYKHSFKTADVGMTETSGENGLRFEIWFRRRTSKNQAYILQAATSDIKQTWTSDIARILWQQATRNKEIRMQEMVSMGVGNKPFLDIKPSDAAINDRAIDYIMKGRGARTRASIAVSLFDHSNPFNRAAVSAPISGTSGTGGPSSSTLLGPLNLHVYSSQTLLPGERPLISPCIEEDELEHETSSQPSMTTESSGSSSHCLSGSGSSGSDSGCVSSHLPETLSEEPGSPCDTSCYSSEHKAGFSSQYISAKGAQVLGPSTTV